MSNRPSEETSKQVPYWRLCDQQTCAQFSASFWPVDPDGLVALITLAKRELYRYWTNYGEMETGIW
jgi:hypothetical protein